MSGARARTRRAGGRHAAAAVPMLPPGAESGRVDLSAEAIRLTRQLALACDEPEVAGLSAGAARSRVVLARRLAERAEVRAAVCSGDLSVDHARLVTTWSAPRRPDARRVTAETTWGAVLGAAAVRRLSCDASSCGSSPRGEPAARRRPPLPHRAGGDPRRSGRPGRRLHVSRLRPATAVVRWSPHHPLGTGRRDARGQLDPALPTTPPNRPRRTLADHPRIDRPLDHQTRPVPADGRLRLRPRRSMSGCQAARFGLAG